MSVCVRGGGGGENGTLYERHDGLVEDSQGGVVTSKLVAAQNAGAGSGSM